MAIDQQPIEILLALGLNRILRPMAEHLTLSTRENLGVVE